MNQDEFFQANAVDGNLSDAQMMVMLSLPTGDSAPAQTSVPDAGALPNPAPDVAAKAVEPDPEPKPVILAKDGVHTIDYEKLVEAREAEKHWKQVALDAQAQLEAQKAAPAAPTDLATADADVADLFGDFSEAEIANGVKKLVAANTAALKADFDEKLNAVLAPLQAQQEQSAEDAHFSAIEAAHPDAEQIAQSEQFAQWLGRQPSFVREGYQAVIDQGTAEQVIEALNTYKADTGKLAAPPVQTSAAAAAQAAIANARTKPPMSLSEIPALSNASADESAAMLDMSVGAVMSKFDGKTPEQIMAIMNRIL